MSKELTEQWRNGTLEENRYYVKLPEEIIIANIYQLKQLDLVNDADEIEVLDSVPTYDEFVQQRDFVKDHLKVLIENMNLKRKLEIATNALKRYEDKQNWDIRGVAFMKYNKGFTIARKALKEMKGE